MDESLSVTEKNSLLREALKELYRQIGFNLNLVRLGWGSGTYTAAIDVRVNTPKDFLDNYDNIKFFFGQYDNINEAIERNPQKTENPKYIDVCFEGNGETLDLALQDLSRLLFLLDEDDDL